MDIIGAQPEIRVFPTPQALFDGAAAEFAARAAAAVQKNGRFTVALSGGSTPKALYSELAGESFRALPWNKIFFFWGDERHVPPDHRDSNYRMTYQSMLSKLPVPQDNIFRIKAEGEDAGAVAADYEQTLRTFFRLEKGCFPRFDLILLGLGPDGHTASLFPGTAALKESQRLVVANRVDAMDADRLTFTFPVLNHAACDMFLISGAEKAERVHEILDEGQNFPAAQVRPADGALLWMLDRAAAGKRN
jgi:6-phosphogluconolactonase